jgi:hypothetical protein
MMGDDERTGRPKPHAADFATIAVTAVALSLLPPPAAAMESANSALTWPAPGRQTLEPPTGLTNKPCPKARRPRDMISLLRNIKMIYQADLLNRICFYDDSYVTRYFGGSKIFPVANNLHLSRVQIDDIVFHDRNIAESVGGGVQITGYLAQNFTDSSIPTPLADVTVALVTQNRPNCDAIFAVFGERRTHLSECTAPRVRVSFAPMYKPDGIHTGPLMPIYHNSPEDVRSGTISYDFRSRGSTYHLKMILMYNKTLGDIELTRDRD